MQAVCVVAMRKEQLNYDKGRSIGLMILQYSHPIATVIELHGDDLSLEVRRSLYGPFGAGPRGNCIRALHEVRR